MSPRTKNACSALAIAVSAFAAAPGHAQDTGKAPAGVEEIIVTAQKRSENLQRVPIAVTALSAKTAAALGVKDTTDLQIATPGLVMHHQGYSLTPVLRGISTQLGSAGEESPIATYVDGVYLVNPSSAIFSLNNIERIEVLKGPQGTLFGRNAVGGVVNVITRKPKHTPEITATVGYGNYKTPETSFYGTTGISPNIAVDLSVYWRHQYDGYGKVVAAPGQVNPALGKPTFLSKDFAVRNKWLITPSDATEITLSADYSKGSNGLGTARRLLPGTTAASNVIPNDVGPIGGFWDIRSDAYPQTATYKSWGVSATIDQKFSWAKLRSITAYRNPKVNSFGDQDSVERPLFNAFTPTTLRQFSQELQLLSADSSRIKWILGLYYLNADYNADNIFVGTLFGPLGYNSFNDVRTSPTTKSLAGFGEVTVPLGKSTHLTAGARYTYDRQHIDGVTLNNAGPVPNSRADKTESFRKPTWRLSLDHQFTPSFMAYISYNRGFKSGIFSATAPTDPSVHPTTLDAYEIGFKSQLFHNKLRFNASAFYYDIKDIQLTVLNPAGGASLLLLNAAAGKVKGVDADIEAVPAEHFTLRLGGEYLDTKYKNFANAPVGIANPPGSGPGFGGVTIVREDVSGTDFLYSPKWTINASALYDLPTQIGDFDFAVNYYRQSSFLGYFASFKEPGYDLVNMSAGWTSPNDRWNVKLWAKNLTNEEYYNHIAIGTRRAAGSPGAPRTYGITLGVKWGG